MLGGKRRLFGVFRNEPSTFRGPVFDVPGTTNRTAVPPGLWPPRHRRCPISVGTVVMVCMLKTMKACLASPFVVTFESGREVNEGMHFSHGVSTSQCHWKVFAPMLHNRSHRPLVPTRVFVWQNVLRRESDKWEGVGPACQLSVVALAGNVFAVVWHICPHSPKNVGRQAGCVSCPWNIAASILNHSAALALAFQQHVFHTFFDHRVHTITGPLSVSSMSRCSCLISLHVTVPQCGCLKEAVAQAIARLGVPWSTRSCARRHAAVLCARVVRPPFRGFDFPKAMVDSTVVLVYCANPHIEPAFFLAHACLRAPFVLEVMATIPLVFF